MIHATSQVSRSCTCEGGRSASSPRSERFRSVMLLFDERRSLANSKRGKRETIVESSRLPTRGAMIPALDPESVFLLFGSF